jgi:hypothetical protein
LKFDDEGYEACIDTSDNDDCEDGERVVKNGQMPPGIDLQDDTLGNTVTFNRRGFPAGGGNVVVSNGSQTRTINLTLAGTSSVQ